MPPLAVAAVAAIATTTAGVIAAGSIAAFSFLGLTGALAVAASFATSFVVSMALGFISSALGPKPPSPNDIGLSSIEREAKERTQTVRSSTSPRTFVYGRTRVSGPLVFASSTGDNKEYFHMVIAIAGREISEVEFVYLNDEWVGTIGADGNVTGTRFEGFARVKVHLGGDNQQADSDLVSEVSSWSNQHKLRGIAYLYVRLKYDPDVFATGIPNVSARVKGHALYDPRTALTAWSNNPALCVWDYLTNAQGLGASTDDLNLAAFQAAANVCDELATNPEGISDQRYWCDGVVRLDQKPIDIIQALLSTMVGTLVFSRGEYFLYPAAYATPTITLNEDHLRGELRVRAKPGRRETFNGVKGTYIDPVQNYMVTDFPRVSNRTYVAQDNNEDLFRDIELPFTVGVYHAQRIATIILERARQGIIVEFPAKFHAVEIETWSVINLTIAQLGWTDKPFRVTNWSIATDGGGVDLVLQEESSSSYTGTTLTAADPAPNTNLPNPFNVSPLVATISDELILSASGTVLSRLVVDLTEPNDAFVVDYEVQYRKSGETNWIAISLGSATRFTVEGVEDGSVYEIRTRARNSLGVRSAFLTYTYTIVGQTAPPGDVANFSVNIVGSNAHLTWTPNTDLDLSHYRVRWSPLTSGATWGGATDVVVRVAKPASSVTVPALVGTYLIKAADFKGIESTNAASSISTLAGLESFNAVETLTENPGFAGTHSNTTAPDSLLILDTSLLFDDATGNFDDATGEFDSGGGSGFVVSEGTYTFSDYIDLGDIYSSRVTANIEMTALDYENLFDDTAGDFDDHDGLFDGETPSLVDVTLEIRTTNDDPTGAPVWSDWRSFNVGDYSCRAFQFRAILTTQRSTITPAISVLEVSVDMPDRVIGDRNVTSNAAGSAIVFASAFKTTPVIGVTGNNLATGDYFAITSQTATGFTVRFFNSAGVGISRVFDWLAKGY
jgi:hypothetical protein